jgi:hypothetical protein
MQKPVNSLSAGGGNVLNVQRTVKQLINVGAKGCFLEDQRWPKRVGHMRNKEVISMEEFAGKVRRCHKCVISHATCLSIHGMPDASLCCVGNLVEVCSVHSKEVASVEESAEETHICPPVCAWQLWKPPLW